MNNIIVYQGNTITVNYNLEIDLTFLKVYFKVEGITEPIRCIEQSIRSQPFVRWSLGGLAIPFTNLPRPGMFPAQFQLVDRLERRTTLPSIFLEVKKSL
jgi:hypothetical protein